MSALTDWAAAALQVDEDILVPVKKLWVEYSAHTPNVSLDDFSRALARDARFEFVEGIDPTEHLDDWTEEEKADHIAEMEALGFFGGPRVKMKNREITREHIARMLKKHTDNMMNALWSAFDVRPADLPAEAQHALLDLIAQAKELQLDLQDVLSAEEDQEDHSGEGEKPDAGSA
jgi:hypothetical protein